MRQKRSKLEDSAILAAAMTRGMEITGDVETGKGLCPFHEEKTPSFVIYADTETFHCFGCGKSGGVDDLRLH